MLGFILLSLSSYDGEESPKDSTGRVLNLWGREKLSHRQALARLRLTNRSVIAKDLSGRLAEQMPSRCIRSRI